MYIVVLYLLRYLVAIFELFWILKLLSLFLREVRTLAEYRKLFYVNSTMK